MGVSKENFACRRPGRGLKMPKSSLERSPEFKNGIKVDFGAIWSILGGGNRSTV